MHVTDTARRILVTGDEVDVVGRGRHLLACLVNHPGGVAKTKRRIRRRERRELAHDLRVQLRHLGY